MGPFPIYVLLEGDVKDVATKVAERMAPYDKAVQVAEYDGQCPCVHAQVKDKAPELAKARVQMADFPAGGSEAERNQSAFDCVTKYALDLQDAQRAAIQELLDKAAPNPNCKECGGSGTIKTTANPNGKWTRWEIGGTFSNNTLAEYLSDVVDDPNIVPVNMLNLEEVPTPVAIITSDGKWHAGVNPLGSALHESTTVTGITR